MLDRSADRPRARLRARGPLAAVACLALLAAACGARLSPAQQAALDAQAAGGGAVVAPGATTVPGVTTPTDAGVPGVSTPTDVSVPTGATGVSGPNSAPNGVTPTGRTSQPATTTGSKTPGGTKTSSAPTTGATTYGINAKDGSISINPAICKKVTNGPGISATEIDLGNVSTLTGPIPGIFLGAVHGAQAFATYVNSIGGICGRKLVIKSGDDNLQVSQNAAATQELSSQVFAFIGSFTADDQGGAAVLKANGVPDIGQSLSKDRFHLPNNFAPEPIDGWNVAPYQLMKKLQPEASQHMAIIGSNQEVGHLQYLAQKQAMINAGMKIVYDDPNVEPTQTDYSADAQAMKAAGAQGIGWSATAGLMAATARAVQNAGIPNFLLPTWGTTAYDQAFIKQAGSAAEGSILEIQEALYQGEDAATVPMIGTFNKFYQALYHQTPDEYAMYSWMSGLLFIQGLNNGGAVDQKSLLAGLKQVTSFDAGGMVAPNNPAGKKPPTCYLIVDIKGGKFLRDATNPTGFNCQFAPNYYFTS